MKHITSVHDIRSVMFDIRGPVTDLNVQFSFLQHPTDADWYTYDIGGVPRDTSEGERRRYTVSVPVESLWMRVNGIGKGIFEWPWKNEGETMSEQADKLRNAVRYFYDLQKLRIQSKNRAEKKAEHAEIALDEKDKLFLASTGEGLKKLESEGLKEVSRLLKGIPIYDEWLKEQKGCGPTMSGVLLAEIDIRKAETVSALWAFCGLHVVDGAAPRARRGEKLKYNPWVRAKLVKVLADCLIKANSPWREHYDNYKHRKQNTLVEVCALCKGEGTISAKTVKETETRERAVEQQKTNGKKRAAEKEETRSSERAGSEQKPDGKKRVKCSNCKGTGGPAPWGKSDKHRHQAAMRFMIKMFLQKLWLEWRKLEGLPVTEPYAVAVLGRKHGDHGGTAVHPE